MLLVIFFSSVKSVYFNQFSCLLCIQKLVCVRVAFLSLLCLLTKPYHFGVNWRSTFCENKDGVHFFTLKFEWHIRYNKLLLCNSENGIIAWCKKTIQNGVPALLFFKNKNLLLKKKKNVYKKTKKTGRLGSIKKRVFLNPNYLSIVFCDFPLIARSGTSHATISLIGCAPHTQSIGPW